MLRAEEADVSEKVNEEDELDKVLDRVDQVTK